MHWQTMPEAATAGRGSGRPTRDVVLRFVRHPRTGAPARDTHGGLGFLPFRSSGRSGGRHEGEPRAGPETHGELTCGAPSVARTRAGRRSAAGLRADRAVAPAAVADVQAPGACWRVRVEGMASVRLTPSRRSSCGWCPETV